MIRFVEATVFYSGSPVVYFGKLCAFPIHSKELVNSKVSLSSRYEKICLCSCACVAHSYENHPILVPGWLIELFGGK